MLKLFFVILGILSLGCHKPTRNQKQYLHTLEQLAFQRGKRYVCFYNRVDSPSKRAFAIEASKQAPFDGSNDADSTFHKTLLIETLSEYPNRYLIADTANYNLKIMDIPLPYPEDSVCLVSHIYGKYLGSMVDTTSGTVHQKLVVQIPHQCPIRINGAMKGFSFTDVIVLYDIQGNRVVPIEILDYRCSRINEYDRNAYQDICFCQMKPQSFYDSLKATIVKAKPDESYPVKLKRLLKQK